MKILICGMPRSMTTWTFNVVSALLAEAPKSLWIEPASAEENQFANEGGIILAKCHHYSDLLAHAASLILYSYRDIRTAAVSCRRKFGFECTRAQMDVWVAAGQRWLAHANLVFRYETVAADPMASIAKLRRLLTEHGLPLSSLTDAEIAEKIDEQFAKSAQDTGIHYDATTMILPQHCTYSPEPDKLSTEDRALYDCITKEQAAWLHDFGYLGADAYGQDIEYRLSTLLLTKLFKAPIVVDVGVERGSFTQLALEAGAEQVIGFEPLPRHLARLGEVFSGETRVSIHPLAISNHSGRAVLHIATDLSGKELDYHHSLSDLGDSATVVRSQKTLEVDTATLSDLVICGKLPSQIDFLKIDTDGHDLAVLEGLGDLRPGVIMAEYWDHLTESSGNSPYKLADLAQWASSHEYHKLVVIRRNGRLEMLEQDIAYSIAGDWGNVFMIRSDLTYSTVGADICAYAKTLHQSTVGYLRSLVNDVEEKEREIRHLDNALQEQKQLLLESDTYHQTSELEAKESVIQELKAAYENAQAQLEQFESVIQQQGNELSSFKTLLGDSEAEIEIEIEILTAQIGERDQTIKELRDSAMFASVSGSTHTNQALVKSLEEKEAVIQELAKAVNQYRMAFQIFGYLLRPANRIKAATAGIRNRLRAIVAPRLGNLYQHAPRPMCIPMQYGQAIALTGTPKISIVTPSYSQASFIARTIDSILNQNYPNLEYFVQDGGSTDGTVDVLHEYSGRLAGWASAPDGGQSHAINLGFAKTSGGIMAWLNSDDILLPGALAYVADFFTRHPEVDVVYGNRLLIDENDMEIGRWILPGHDGNALSWADYVPQETLFWRRAIWEKVGGINESFRFAMDWDLLVRFREAGARFAHIPRFLGAFRIHEQQKTSAVINETGFQEMNRIRERIHGRVPSRKQIHKAVLPFLTRHVVVDLCYRIKRRTGKNR